MFPHFTCILEATGPDRVILSTDFGQVVSDPFPEGSVRFGAALEALLPARVGRQTLVRMFTENPRRALGLPAPSAPSGKRA
jgi:hypothetical protein